MAYIVYNKFSIFKAKLPLNPLHCLLTFLVHLNIGANNLIILTFKKDI